MRLILLGPPGAGKGTQAKTLSAHYQIPTISTGALIRNAIAEGSAFGKKAAEIINQGNLLPDDVIIGMVKERLAKDDCKNGYILDGFPRTIGQAEALSASEYDVDKVLCIEAEDDEIVTRLEGRRECETCRATYHTKYNPSKQEGVCDVCGGRLVRRADDDPATIRNRLEIYHSETKALVGYYRSRNMLVVAHSQKELADTRREVFKALGETE